MTTGASDVAPVAAIFRVMKQDAFPSAEGRNDGCRSGEASYRGTLDLPGLHDECRGMGSARLSATVP